MGAVQDPLEDPGVDLLLVQDPLRQVEHRHGRAERALVELLDGGLHHEGEAGGPLLGILAERDQLVHRLQRTVTAGARPGAAAAPVAAAGGATIPQPGRLRARTRKTSSVRGSIPTSRRRARYWRSSLSLCEETAAVVRTCEIRFPWLSGIDAAERAGRLGHPRERFEHDGESPQPLRGLIGEHRAGPRRRAAPAADPGCGGAPSPGQCRAWTVEAIEVSAWPSRARFSLKQRALFLRAVVLDDQLGELLEVLREGLAGDQLELAHDVDLLQGVVEVARDRHRRAVEPDLGRGPRLDLDRHELRRALEEQAERVRDHQRREVVGEVLLQLVESRPRLDVRRVVLQCPSVRSRY